MKNLSQYFLFLSKKKMVIIILLLLINCSFYFVEINPYKISTSMILLNIYDNDEMNKLNSLSAYKTIISKNKYIENYYYLVALANSKEFKLRLREKIKGEYFIRFFNVKNNNLITLNFYSKEEDILSKHKIVLTELNEFIKEKDITSLKNDISELNKYVEKNNFNFVKKIKLIESKTFHLGFFEGADDYYFRLILSPEFNGYEGFKKTEYALIINFIFIIVVFYSLLIFDNGDENVK